MRRVAIVVHAIYPGDPRVRRQSDALTDAGYEVDVFALRQPGEAADETDGALRIVRLEGDRVHRLVGGKAAGERAPGAAPGALEQVRARPEAREAGREARSEAGRSSRRRGGGG